MPYGPETAERLVPARDVLRRGRDGHGGREAARHRPLPRPGHPGGHRRSGRRGGIDPTAVQVTDLCETHTDQLAKDVRKYLRRRHDISATAPLGVKAVWSVEEPRETLSLPGDEDGHPRDPRPARTGSGGATRSATGAWPS